LDIQVFEKAVSGCQDIPGQELTAEQAASLEEAADLYVGDLLEGIYEDWCLYDRERLRLLHMNTLGKLVACHEHHGAYERGLAYGKQILTCDPTREKVHRQMMRLYWLLGDRNEALTQYKCCAQILREELDIPPMEETRLLYKQMVRNQFDPASWPPHQTPLSSEQSDREDAVLLLAKHALQRLHRLQAMTDETSAELHQLERLISKALSDARRA
jgi:DNA-binding SARP family transcriptional activator